jgi:hypothetical protein
MPFIVTLMVEKPRFLIMVLPASLPNPALPFWLTKT